MKRNFAAAVAFLVGLAGQNAKAGDYLQLLHNNSDESVYITATVPAGWVGLPHYPVIARPKHSLFDERVYDRAYYKLCRHKIRNVAVPPGGACHSGTSMEIRVGHSRVYRLYDCNWKIHVERKEGNRWVSSGGLDIPKPARPVFFWSAIIERNGTLKISGEQKNLHHGDDYRQQ